MKTDNFIETDVRVLHLNELHKVKVCGSCKSLKNKKCIIHNKLIDSSFQQCDNPKKL